MSLKTNHNHNHVPLSQVFVDWFSTNIYQGWSAQQRDRLREKQGLPPFFSNILDEVDTGPKRSTIDKPLSSFDNNVPTYPRWPNPPDEETELFIDGEWSCEVPIEETEKEIKKVTCTVHKWKTYVGLMETFEYCELCDKKKTEEDDIPHWTEWEIF